MTLEQYGGEVVCRYLARATRVIVASYKNEEASIFHRPTTAFSPISNETLPATRDGAPRALRNQIHLQQAALIPGRRNSFARGALEAGRSKTEITEGEYLEARE